ncbi:ORF 21 [Haloarcula hispanica virus SH1]|uniref:ORF 21 n=1 Tax=Haloarcula hispanica SH1 virus TaxID=326574 RepID=Q4KPG6_9VIRU|nr:ORF 21 [Haloarcula hispanica virus SH1]AAY24947.1 ORF 21 [Haloarcula hispanica virus SH1]
MGDTPAVDEIRQQEQGGNDGGDGDDDGQDGTGMFDGGIPTFGLSRAQMLLIALVVVALLAWKLRDSSGDSEGGTKAREAVDSMRDPDLGDVTVREDDDAEEVEVVLPADPDNELEKDEAIIQHFKNAGHIEGDDE